MKNIAMRTSGLLIVSLALLFVWYFPEAWCSIGRRPMGGHWLKEWKAVPDWAFRPISLNESAEKQLSADEIVHGEFSNVDIAVRVFSARRFHRARYDFELFVHTPDRCWVQTGWDLEWAKPDCLVLEIADIPILFERRVFKFGARRELVYFGGLIGGHPPPYRLDHNLKGGMDRRFLQ